MAQNLGHGSRLRNKRLCAFLVHSPNHFSEIDYAQGFVTSVTAGLTYIQHLCVGHPELELDTVDKLCDMIIASDPHIINIGQRLMKSLPLS